MLEFALVAILLFTLIFGIINFGLLLSFKQDMTRAAAEGARAAPSRSRRHRSSADALAATRTAIKAFGGRFASSSTGCDAAGMTCTIDPPADCAGDPTHSASP